jgi:hypothetical protein
MISFENGIKMLIEWYQNFKSELWTFWGKTDSVNFIRDYQWIKNSSKFKYKIY